jgi:D-alanyl-D-alanine carboxypeptidase/D-alanyl-D-alanine-endopeptidase (penicillin-binding protein 4)
MRTSATLLAIAAAMTAAPANAVAAKGGSAQRTLRSSLSGAIRAAGSASGAEVVDLSTGKTLFAAAAGARRLPASVEKLYTTSTALLRFGPSATLQTTLYGTGSLDSSGTWDGTLYLRGGGDPTFGSASFDQNAYGTGATIQRLVAELLSTAGVHALNGRVIGDESYFDSLRGTAPNGFQADPYVEGLLSGLAYDRGFANEQESSFQLRPARFAATQLISALRTGGVLVPPRTPVGAGATPPGAEVLAAVQSPPMSTLIGLTNTPSDNFLAEMLLKGLGARFAGAGSSAAGSTVVKSALANAFGIHPLLEDGSGLSRNDATSPREVVTALEHMASNADFVQSLPIAGQTGTLAQRMLGTRADGRCEAKTGTLHDVSNLAGYCRAADGHTLVFAFLMNSVDPTAAQSLQDSMTVALARYKG